MMKGGIGIVEGLGLIVSALYFNDMPSPSILPSYIYHRNMTLCHLTVIQHHRNEPLQL